MEKLISLVVVLFILVGCERTNRKPTLELANSLMTSSIIYVQVIANESTIVKRISVNDSEECEVGYATEKDYKEGISLQHGEKYAFSVSDCPISNIKQVALITDKGKLIYSLTPPEEELLLNFILPENKDTELLFVAEPLVNGIRLINVRVSGGTCKLSESLKEGLKKDYVNNNGEPYHLYFDNCSLENIEQIELTTEKRSYKWIK